MDKIEVVGGFLVLHEPESNDEVFIACDAICGIQISPDKKGAVVQTDENSYRVVEQPRQIMEAANEACEAWL